jgi:hypothetical protein
MLLKARVTVTALVEIRLFGTTLVSRPETVYFDSRPFPDPGSGQQLNGNLHNPDLNVIRTRLLETLICSVLDPWHFDTDPDPQIRTL